MKKPEIEDGIGRCAHINGLPVKSEMVEEMIDALIEARQLLNQKYFIREGDSLVLSKIEQALKKAGVQL